MIYSFGSMELDLAKVELRDGGEPRSIEPQVFALIAYLAEHRDRMVSRDELFEKLWEGRVVSDSALSSRIKSARRVLGDDGRTQAIIKTVHGQGLRFIADVRVRHAPAIAAPGDISEEAEKAAPKAVPDTTSRPSIAVLPFRSSGAEGWAAIADGLPHDLITELARLRWLFVVARGSSFRLRDDDLDPREVGRLLGVRYCLSGTVEVSGNRLVVTTELVDTRGGDVVWGERYTGDVQDLHTIRDEIRVSILASLEIQIPLHEAGRARLISPDNMDAWSAYHLGLQHIYGFNQRDNALAAELFSRAVELDAGFARAHAGLSFVHFQTAFLRQTDDIAGTIRQARDCAQRGVDMDPLDPFVNFTMGRTYWLEDDLDRSLAWLERATSLSPNYAQGIYAQAWTEFMGGTAVPARQHVDLAMQLSPLDPLHYAMLALRGLTHVAAGDDQTAAAWAERGARAPGAHALIAMIAAAAQSLAGNDEHAQRWAAEVRNRNPRLTREDFFGAFPMKAESVRQRISAALESLKF
ncbi:MAG: winged helix-turn-helix domain-containing protein [Gammaproteobacteria bacterium]|nr:winged helix-turn-helix domain-containing protein [Gammaproteobacteria bacterium]